MSIQFNSEGMPSRAVLLDQAAGVGIEFEPDSMEEMYFLDICRILWTHGYCEGIKRFSRALDEKKEGSIT